jgi:hypothetical protein
MRIPMPAFRRLALDAFRGFWILLWPRAWLLSYSLRADSTFSSDARR